MTSNLIFVLYTREKNEYYSIKKIVYFYKTKNVPIYDHIE